MTVDMRPMTADMRPMTAETRPVFLEAVYEKNVRLLREMFGTLPDVLPKTRPPEVEARPTPEGRPTLALNGLLIHSARAPQKEAARLAGAACNAAAACHAAAACNPRFVILLGFGLGYAALEAAAAAEASAAAASADSTSETPLFLIVEKRPEALWAALHVRDWTEFFTRNRVMVLLDSDSSAVWAALNAAGALLQDDKKTPVILKNRALMGLDSAYYREIEHNIGIWQDKNAVNTATLARFGRRWERNLKANQPALKRLPGVRALFNSRAGQPVLLLAAGPSLDDIAPHTGELRKRFVLVAVDTALRFLVRAGVEPDFVVSGDAQYWNFRHLDPAGRFTQTAFIFDLAVYPAALRLFEAGKTDKADKAGKAGGGGEVGGSGGGEPAAAGEGGGGRQTLSRAYLSSSNVPGAAALEAASGGENKGKLASGGSVATSAWDFCRLLGASEIWIAGLDLSFPALKTHYKGAFFEERALAAATRLSPASTASFKALHALPLSGVPALSPPAAAAADGAGGAAASSGGAGGAAGAGGTSGTVLTDARLRLYAGWFAGAFSRYPVPPSFSLSPRGMAIAGLKPACITSALAKPILRP